MCPLDEEINDRGILTFVHGYGDVLGYKAIQVCFFLVLEALNHIFARIL